MTTEDVGKCSYVRFYYTSPYHLQSNRTRTYCPCCFVSWWVRFIVPQCRRFRSHSGIEVGLGDNVLTYYPRSSDTFTKGCIVVTSPGSFLSSSTVLNDLPHLFDGNWPSVSSLIWKGMTNRLKFNFSSLTIQVVVFTSLISLNKLSKVFFFFLVSPYIQILMSSPKILNTGLCLFPGFVL